jgi:glucose uptake protein GlcU
MELQKIERIIADDRRGHFTILALLSAIGMLINAITLFSPALEIPLALTYFLINSVFCGSIFFQEENTGFRIVLGLLTLLMLIALGCAIVIIASSLFPTRLDMKTIIAVLSLITTALSFTKHTKINEWLNPRQ